MRKKQRDEDFAKTRRPLQAFCYRLLMGGNPRIGAAMTVKSQRHGSFHVFNKHTEQYNLLNLHRQILVDSTLHSRQTRVVSRALHCKTTDSLISRS